MYACMYVYVLYIYICMYACMYVYIYIYIHIYAYIYILLCMCVYVYLYIHTIRKYSSISLGNVSGLVLSGSVVVKSSGGYQGRATCLALIV